ncbi:hypothetical protein J1605_017253 [Eschrichtius robustus]|uniref:Uncharacterized protein n=1 Tax=Eschrichtius robustus TaxID=9764 RepID=A0AB34I0T3_ESCRO|nr:hypothetical protein J1605_017253 [Eschrichtius robustus]
MTMAEALGADTVAGQVAEDVSYPPRAARAWWVPPEAPSDSQCPARAPTWGQGPGGPPESPISQGPLHWTPASGKLPAPQPQKLQEWLKHTTRQLLIQPLGARPTHFTDGRAGGSGAPAFPPGPVLEGSPSFTPLPAPTTTRPPAPWGTRHRRGYQPANPQPLAQLRPPTRLGKVKCIWKEPKGPFERSQACQDPKGLTPPSKAAKAPVGLKERRRLGNGKPCPPKDPGESGCCCDAAGRVPRSRPPRGVGTLQTPTLLPSVLLLCLEPLPPPHPVHRVQEPPAPAEAVCPVGILTPGPSQTEELRSE